MDLEEYKARNIKTIKLPSGLEVKVRQLNPHVLLRIREELGVDSQNIYNHAGSLLERLFKLFLVDPSIPDDIDIADLKKEDYLKLQDLIWEQVSFPEE